jgi:hypothetical protein
MLSAASTSDDAVSALCGGDMTDACETYRTYHACYTAAYNLAASQAPVPLPNASPFKTGKGYSEAALGVVTEAYSNVPPSSVPDRVTLGRIVSGAASLINTLFALRDASATCHP